MENPVPPWAQTLSAHGLLMFAIWWLSKQNTKLSQDSSAEKNEMRTVFREEKATLKKEHEERFDEMKMEYKEVQMVLQAEVRELRSFIFRAFEGADLSQTTKRAHLKLKDRENAQ